MAQEYRLILKYADEPGYTPDLECYLRHGGYEALQKALTMPPKTLPDGKTMGAPERIRDEVKLSGLRGRGGAGFSCGLKWSFVDRRSGKPIYLICNADESEPGTFKDRQILYKDPHQMVEGMIISCYANDVKLAYIYIRGEFAEGARILNRALKEAREKNFLGKNILGSGYDLEIHVHRGAGAYICGEAGALPVPDDREQRGNAMRGEAYRGDGRGGICEAGHGQQHRHAHCEHQRPREEAGLF